jgi:hypothetical protein
MVEWSDLAPTVADRDKMQNAIKTHLSADLIFAPKGVATKGLELHQRHRRDRRKQIDRMYFDRMYNEISEFFLA